MRGGGGWGGALLRCTCSTPAKRMTNAGTNSDEGESTSVEKCCFSLSLTTSRSVLSLKCWVEVLVQPLLLETVLASQQDCFSFGDFEQHSADVFSTIFAASAWHV